MNKIFQSGIIFVLALGTFLYVKAMDTESSSSAHAASEREMKEILADPVKWNNWLIGSINKHFKEPYADGNRTIQKRIDQEEYIVNRPNHALGHGMRQGFLAVDILNGFEQVYPEDFTSSGTADFIKWVQENLKTDPYFRKKIQMTASFQRTGRQSEADISTQSHLVKKYEFQDSENFYKDAKSLVGILFKNDDELRLYKQSILKSSEFKDTPFPPTKKELQYLRRIIWTSHTLDLRRLVKTEFNEPTVMANATKSLFGQETAFSDPLFKDSHIYPQFKAEGYFIKKLWEYSRKYLQATGDRYNGEFEDKFYIQAKHPDQMVTALIEANNSLKSVPHPIGLFVYAACPLETSKPILVKSKKKGQEALVEAKGKGLQAVKPQTSYQWCALLKQKKDGSYGLFDGRVSSFEDEANTVQLRVREASEGLYDIDPATFDRDIPAPLDKNQPLSELKRRSLNRLPNETPAAYKARRDAMASLEARARHDEQGLEGETLQDLRFRRASEPPSSLQATSGQKVNYKIFFKEVPFQEAKKFIEAGKVQKGTQSAGEGFAWIPVQYLNNIQNETINFTPGPGYYAFFERGDEKESAGQLVQLKVYSPLVQLLSQQDAQKYLKDKIIDKPVPMATINRIKAHMEMGEKKVSNQQSSISTNVYTMFDKSAQEILGQQADQEKDELKLEQMIQIHNAEAERMIGSAKQYAHAAAEYAFYSITPDSQKSLLQMVNNEQKLYPWFSFIHAVPAQIYYGVYEFAREMRSLISGKSLKEVQILRVLDDVFNIIQNIDDFYKKSEEEYGKGGAETLDKTAIFRKQGLSVNNRLFGGLQEAKRSGHLKAEYSIHRWLAGYSDINNPNIAQEILAQVLTSLGIPKDRVKRYKALVDEYFTPSQSTDWNNINDAEDVMRKTEKRRYGVMIQMFINPEIIDKIAYLAGAGGNKLELKAGETVKGILEKMRSKTEDSKAYSGVQTRLFLDPKYFHDPKYVKMFSYLSKDTRKPIGEFLAKLKKLVAEDAAFLLSSNAPVTKESVGEHQPLLELHERVTGNIREQTAVSDQKIVDWFAAKQTEAIRTYYEKNPGKVNVRLKNVQPLSYLHEKVETPKKGYLPIQLAVMNQNQELLLYFLDKLDLETQKFFLSENISMKRGYGIWTFDPLGLMGDSDFNLKEVVPKLYAKLGNALFDYLFQTMSPAGVPDIMEAFNETNSVPLNYMVENLFSKPSYLRGLQHIRKLNLREDQVHAILTKSFDDLWEVFKSMPFFTGQNLPAEDQKYYSALFEGKDVNYSYIAPVVLKNKFTLYLLESFLKDIRFGQLEKIGPNDFAQGIYDNEIKDDFIERSMKQFLNLMKANLPSVQPKRSWEYATNPLYTFSYGYDTNKEKSLNEKDKIIYAQFKRWLHKFFGDY